MMYPLVALGDAPELGRAEEHGRIVKRRACADVVVVQVEDVHVIKRVQRIWQVVGQVKEEQRQHHVSEGSSQNIQPQRGLESTGRVDLGGGVRLGRGRNWKA